MSNDGIKTRTVTVLVKMAVVVGLLAGAGTCLYLAFMAPPQPRTREVIEMIRSEELAFLVTDRVVTRVMVESNENNLLLGKREGYLMATVRSYVGLDLKSLPEDAVEVSGGTAYVTVPDPKELDFSVDLNSARFLSKRSGLIVLRDFLQNLNLQRELERQLHEAAARMMSDEELMPKREDLLRRLNAWAPALSGKFGLKVLFR